jgi:hypothetical protein
VDDGTKGLDAPWWSFTERPRTLAPLAIHPHPLPDREGSHRHAPANSQSWNNRTARVDSAGRRQANQ